MHLTQTEVLIVHKAKGNSSGISVLGIEMVVMKMFSKKFYQRPLFTSLRPPPPPSHLFASSGSLSTPTPTPGALIVIDLGSALILISLDSPWSKDLIFETPPFEKRQIIDPNILDALGRINGWERSVHSGISRDDAWVKELERAAGTPSPLPTSITVGAKVLLSIPVNRSGNKFSGNFYKDPYTVVSCFDNNTFLLMDSSGKPLKRRVYGTRLKILACSSLV